MLAYACLPQLSLKKAKIDREVYVISLASDLRGESNHRPAAVGAANTTLTDLSTDVEAALKFMVVSVSNIFHHIDKDQPVSLSGDGIVLYPPADPQGMLALHFAVVESDQKARNFGALLKQLFSDKEVSAGLKEIGKLVKLTRSVPQEVLAAFMGASVTALGNVLEKNQDDILFSHNHSGLEMAKYGGTADGKEYPLGNKKIGCTLRVYVQA